MKSIRAIAQLIGLWLVITATLFAVALVLAPADIRQPQQIFRSTT